MVGLRLTAGLLIAGLWAPDTQIIWAQIFYVGPIPQLGHCDHDARIGRIFRRRTKYGRFFPWGRRGDFYLPLFPNAGRLWIMPMFFYHYDGHGHYDYSVSLLISCSEWLGSVH